MRSEDVNDYLREAAGTDDVSAKDFRTWTATVHAFEALHQVSAEDEASEQAAAESGTRHARRRNPILEALRRTAEELGDSVAVTRSAYVHPGVLEAFDGDSAADGGRRRRLDLDGPPDRRTELEVLALLRRASRTTGSSVRGRSDGGARAARRSQVGGAAVAGRSSGGRA